MNKENKEELIKFQKELGMKVDGIVGLHTLRAIAEFQEIKRKQREEKIDIILDDKV